MIRSSRLQPIPRRQPWPAGLPPMARPSWDAFDTRTPSLLERRGAEIALTVRSVMGECRTLIGLGSKDDRALRDVSRLLAPEPFVVMTPGMADAPVEHCLVVLSDADWVGIDADGAARRLARVREMLGRDSALLMHHDEAMPTPAPVLAAAGFTYHCAWSDPDSREAVVLAWL